MHEHDVIAAHEDLANVALHSPDDAVAAEVLDDRAAAATAAAAAAAAAATAAAAVAAEAAGRLLTLVRRAQRPLDAVERLVRVEQDHVEVAIERLELAIAVAADAIDAADHHAHAGSAAEAALQQREWPCALLATSLLNCVVREQLDDPFRRAARAPLCGAQQVLGAPNARAVRRSPRTKEEAASDSG